MTAPSVRRDGPLAQRKADHVHVVAERDTAMRRPSGFEAIEFEHCALPEIALDQIDLRAKFLGRVLEAPLMVTAMTGGCEEAAAINRDLAAACDEEGVVFGLGSMRAAVDEPGLADTYAVRAVAPHVFLCGNLGAVQLKAISLPALERLVSRLGCDALCVHLNPMHEAIQVGGDTDWRGVQMAIANACWSLPVPVIAKEVGGGINPGVATKLEATGVAAIDISGAGGTSWSGGVESYRGAGPEALTYWDWGIPTALALRDAVRTVRVPIIASGGIRNGLDAAKALRLGAVLAGAAAPFLKAQQRGGREAVRDELRQWKREIRLACFGTGSPDLDALRKAPLYRTLGRTLEGER